MNSALRGPTKMEKDGRLCRAFFMTRFTRNLKLKKILLNPIRI